MPRLLAERFESKGVTNLAKKALKNQDVKKEYGRIEEGIHLVNIGKKSTFVNANKVLIKSGEGRYLVEVRDTHVDILGFVFHGNTRAINTFENLMNELYNVDLQY